MCELHAKWLTNEITLYVEPKVELIAIKEPIVEPDQPIVVEKSSEMNDEDDGTDSKEVALLMSEHTRGSENIASLTASVVYQNDVSEEPIEGLREGSVGEVVDDNAEGGKPVRCGEVHVVGSVG